MTRIAVIGMGYVGIPAAALLADVEGFDVTGVQRRSKRSGWKIDHLNQGKCPIGGDEPGLPEILQRVVLEKKSFSVTDDISVCGECDYILIDVQTPTDEDHVPRYESLKEVTANLAKHLKKGACVIIESTCAPGTTDYIVKPILEEHSGMTAGKDFHLVFSYERVMVGRLLHNIQNYPRIVGGIDEKSTEKGIWLYEKIVKAEVIPTDSLTAEIAKVTENAYRDVNIAFSNEIALICESLGADVYEVRKLVNTLPNDPSNPLANPHRNMHVPGAGVGGHCLPKDSWLLKFGLDNYGHENVEPRILVDSRRINDFMPVHLAELTKATIEAQGGSMRGAKIAVLGYAFLQDSDDTRNTPTRTYIEMIEGMGAKAAVHDPHVRLEECDFIERDLDSVLEGAICMAILTKHKEYEGLDLERAKGLLKLPIIIDGRDTFDKKAAEEKGFVYLGIGKGR